MLLHVSLVMYEPTLMTFDATDGSPMVLSPAPLLPAEMNIWTLLWVMSWS